MSDDAAGPDLHQARSRLNDERERLEHTLTELLAEHREDGPIDIQSGDAGADSTEADTNLGLTADVRHEIAEVDAALERLDAGTYGIDEETGEPIDPARLEAVPTARTNVRR